MLFNSGIISLVDNQPRSPPLIEDASSENFFAASSKVIRLFNIDCLISLILLSISSEAHTSFSLKIIWLTLYFFSFSSLRFLEL